MHTASHQLVTGPQVTATVRIHGQERPTPAMPDRAGAVLGSAGPAPDTAVTACAVLFPSSSEMHSALCAVTQDVPIGPGVRGEFSTWHRVACSLGWGLFVGLSPEGKHPLESEDGGRTLAKGPGGCGQR